MHHGRDASAAPVFSPKEKTNADASWEGRVRRSGFFTQREANADAPWEGRVRRSGFFTAILSFGAASQGNAGLSIRKEEIALLRTVCRQRNSRGPPPCRRQCCRREAVRKGRHSFPMLHPSQMQLLLPVTPATENMPRLYGLARLRPRLLPLCFQRLEADLPAAGEKRIVPAVCTDMGEHIPPIRKRLVLPAISRLALRGVAGWPHQDLRDTAPSPTA